MGFLSKIFKKKSGGTKFGNFLRGVASSVSGGKWGQGKNMIPASDETQVALNSPDNVANNLGSETGNFIKEQIQQQIESVATDSFTKPTFVGDSVDVIANIAGKPITKAFLKTAGKTWLERNVFPVILGIVAFIIILVLIFKRKSKGSR